MFRFAEHALLIEPQPNVMIIEINPQKGFEHFIVGVHNTISRVGRGGNYVFDSMHEGLVPDLSLGTHFFNVIVETGMVYLGYFGSREGKVLKQDLLRSLPNVLGELLPKFGDQARGSYMSLIAPLKGGPST